MACSRIMDHSVCSGIYIYIYWIKVFLKFAVFLFCTYVYGEKIIVLV